MQTRGPRWGTYSGGYERERVVVRSLTLAATAAGPISAGPRWIDAPVEPRILGGGMQLKRHLSYAQGYLELGMVAEAAAELDRIPAPESDGIEVLGLRMAVLHEQQRWPVLAKLAADFVQRAPDEAAAWVTWAYATRRCVSLEAAEKILREAEQKHPVEATIQFNLGCYACLRGDLTEAQRRVDRAIALEPKFLDAAATDPDLEALRAATPKAPRKK